MPIRKRIVSLPVLTIVTLCGIPACDAVLDIQDFPAGPINDATSDAANDADAGTPADGAPSLDAPTMEGSLPSDVNASNDATEASVTDAVGTLSDSSADATEPTSGACNDGDKRCSGSAAQTCVGGEWDAAFACDSGACNGAGVCGLCVNGATQCSASSVQTCTNGQWGSPSACGGGEACIGNACAVQLTASGKVVWATVGLPVSGPVASVTDTNASDSAASLTAIIDWGDGSSTSFGIVSGTPGSYSVAGTHTYSMLPTGGQATIAVTVTAPSQAKITSTYSATVRPAATATVTEFTIPTVGAAAQSIALGSDNGVWFTEQMGGKIGRVATTGVQVGMIVEYPVSGLPYGITSGLGAGAPLWFTEVGGPTSGSGTAIGSMNTGGGVDTETSTPTYDEPFDIAADSNGNMWFTEADSNAIGKLNTTSLTITEFALPPTDNTYGIAVASSGIWFSGNSSLGLFNPSTMTFSEFPGHSAGGGITVGPDNNIWFLELGPMTIGTIAPTTKNISDLTIVSTPNGGASAIVTGPDRNLWYTAGDSVVRITTTGAVTEFPTPTRPSTTEGIVVGPDGNIWFTENAGNRIGRIAP